MSTLAPICGEQEGGHPVDVDVLRRRLCWASQLGIVLDVDGSLEFNPLIARILGNRSE